MSKKGGGRGIRRRRRKKGQSREFFRHQMMSGYRPIYKIKYELVEGDIFKFTHRHKAVDNFREIQNYRLWKQGVPRIGNHGRSNYVEEYLDFSKGSFAIWTGDCWLTERGLFLPRKLWWDQFTKEMEPVRICNPKCVQLKVLNQQPRVVKAFRVERLRSVQKIPEVETKDSKSILNWIKKVFA